VPTGSGVVKQWYDYTNKRLRKDFDDGTSKIYDYKTLVDPGNHPGFPNPQGFKFRTDSIEDSCCWLWLTNDGGVTAESEADTMDVFEVEKKAVDEGAGPAPLGEHWSSVKKFPFLQTDDWWFAADGNSSSPGTLQASNTYFRIPGKTSESGYVMGNATFANVRYGAIDDAVFAHPDSRPDFGKCKQCGVDDQCPMWQCMQG